MFARGMSIETYKQLKECLLTLWLYKIALLAIVLQSPDMEEHPKQHKNLIFMHKKQLH